MRAQGHWGDQPDLSIVLPVQNTSFILREPDMHVHQPESEVPSCLDPPLLAASSKEMESSAEHVRG